MAYDPKVGHIGPGVFWTNGRLEIYRHCDRVFSLLCDGVQVMPNGTFEQIDRYLWSEFDVLPAQWRRD